MMNLKQETEYLYSCDFLSDEFDANDSYEHYDRAQGLLAEYKWEDVFATWFEYLVEKCDTKEKIINFINLFIYYGGQDEAIKNPYEFLGYLYYKINFDNSEDEIKDLLEDLSISVLETCGKINIVREPYYLAFKDEKVKLAIEKWKETYGTK